MSDRPILFGGPMVNAIIEGRKTQSRRVVKPKKSLEGVVVDPTLTRLYASELQKSLELQGFELISNKSEWQRWSPPCPYGQPGDRLWVRESGWKPPEITERLFRDGADTWPRWMYAADMGKNDVDWCKEQGWKSVPSIHMPRWASRITLKITDVRVERLQDISEADAIAEGIRFADHGKLCWHRNGPPGDVGDCPAPDHTHQQRPGFYWKEGGETDSNKCLGTARAAFGNLWESINAEKHPWKSTPWVWVIDFEQVGSN